MIYERHRNVISVYISLVSLMKIVKKVKTDNTDTKTRLAQALFISVATQASSYWTLQGKCRALSLDVFVQTTGSVTKPWPGKTCFIAILLIPFFIRSVLRVGYNHQNNQAVLFCTLKPNQALPKHFLSIVSDSNIWSYFCQNQYMKTHKDNTLNELRHSSILLFSDFMNIKCSSLDWGF